jgi:DNA-binding NarL/FixJ family response regulator
MRESDLVVVVVGSFAPIVVHGLAALLVPVHRVHIVESSLKHDVLEPALVGCAPRVAILDETAERAVIARLRAILPATGFLVLARNPTRTHGVQLLVAGAACLAHNVSTRDIVAAVRLAAQGGRVFVAADGERVEWRESIDTGPLTPRETEVLELLSEDRSYAEIALRLEVRFETVRTHAARIRRKLGVSHRHELRGALVTTSPPMSNTGLDTPCLSHIFYPPR